MVGKLRNIYMYFKHPVYLKGSVKQIMGDFLLLENGDVYCICQQETGENDYVAFDGSIKRGIRGARYKNPQLESLDGVHYITLNETDYRYNRCTMATELKNVDELLYVDAYHFIFRSKDGRIGFLGYDELDCMGDLHLPYYWASSYGSGSIGNNWLSGSSTAINVPVYYENLGFNITKVLGWRALYMIYISGNDVYDVTHKVTSDCSLIDYLMRKCGINGANKIDGVKVSKPHKADSVDLFKTFYHSGGYIKGGDLYCLYGSYPESSTIEPPLYRSNNILGYNLKDFIIVDNSKISSEYLIALDNNGDIYTNIAIFPTKCFFNYDYYTSGSFKYCYVSQLLYLSKINGITNVKKMIYITGILIMLTNDGNVYTCGLEDELLGIGKMYIGGDVINYYGVNKLEGLPFIKDIMQIGNSAYVMCAQDGSSYGVGNKRLLGIESDNDNDIINIPILMPFINIKNITSDYSDEYPNAVPQYAIYLLEGGYCYFVGRNTYHGIGNLGASWKEYMGTPQQLVIEPAE